MPWLLAIGRTLRAELDAVEQPVSERLAGLNEQAFFRLVSAAGKRCSRSRAASARRCASKGFWPFFGANCASRFFCCCRGNAYG